MRLLSTGRTSFAFSMVCGLFASFCISPHGARCGILDCRPSPRPADSVRELAHRAGVVFEGKLQEELQSAVNQKEKKMLLGQVRVHRVWEIKAGGLEKDAVVSLIWYEADNCLHMNAGTRYMFFMEPTNDTSVFKALSPPVEMKRAVRKDISKALCQTCATPKLKAVRSVTVPEGQKTTLKCELLAGGRQTKFKWYQNRMEIASTKTRKIKMKKRGTLSELHLMKVAESDGGEYQCKVINGYGEDQQSGNVTVIRATTSTTPAAKTSSHVTRCSEKEKGYCVNGGECFTLEVTPKSIKRLCRCPPGFIGDRCQTSDAVRVIDQKQAEELYQKRVLTITGICIALLVVGIMCVVAYCKTKKQRQKLHDRLRQSVRERNALANGQQCPRTPHTPLPPPPQSLQLVSQYSLKNAVPPQHVIEKETETSFSTGHHTLSTQPSNTATHTSSHCWSNGKTVNAGSDTRVAIVILSAEGSRNGTPSHRGRLNATGGSGDLNSHLKNSKEITESYKDSPYSERYVSTMTTPTHLSPVKLLSPGTPSSPPSEMSVPLSSLATSVPSIVTSPSGEEERPLLFHEKSDSSKVQEAIRNRQHRSSAHYNHALEAASPPPSPLHITEDDRYESIQECEGVPTAASTPTSTPRSPVASRPSKRTKAAFGAGQAAQPEVGSDASSESSGSESEMEDEPVSEDTPFLSIQNPGAANTGILALDVLDRSRTNPALRLSPQDDLQTRLASVMANQDPIAV
uniref:Pro-neuregulin-1, membrane-bound isoform n=1 Tax=Electrophorus electricus TaxID=8005 RepID=A0A4W4F2X3_ELEEL